MEKITSQEFQRLIRSCQVLEKDGHGEKVLRRHDGIIIKIFRRKRLLSSALLYPYARRFVHNVDKLRALSVPTMQVVKTGHCKNPQRDLVWYQPVPGQTLRACLQGETSPQLISALGTFVGKLHQKGILFRSLHFGNIIVGENGGFGLIDVADMRFSSRSLALSARQRNFFHMTRYHEDRVALNDHMEKFVQSYLAATTMPSRDLEQLSAWLLEASWIRREELS
jgi:tRNA A-37 threonylcarbamoyl transferase component Bud32